MASSEKDIFVFLLLFLLTPCCSSFAVQSPNQHSLVVGSFAKLRLSHGSEIKVCPDSKLGTLMVCERVHIHGLSRVKNLKKFGHSVTVKVSGRSPGIYLPKAQVCFHRNVSLGIGMCPDKKWETIPNSSWARSMSPFDHKLLDIRTVGSSLESFEVSIEEEFCVYRVVYLVLSIVMMSLASFLSHSLVFYYGASLASGVILVILLVFFQGMKKSKEIIPASPKTSLFIYSSVGFLSFLLYHFHAFWRSILTEVGIDEVFSYALALFLLAFIVLDGAWLGFWFVRKYILTEEGSVDSRTAQFVAWLIQILSALLIIQSSVDTILAAEALGFVITVSSILRRTFRLRIFRRIYRNSNKLAKRKHGHGVSHFPDTLAFDDSFDGNYKLKTPPSSEDFRISSRPVKFAVSPPATAYHGFHGSNHSSELYISSFHTTPERRRFSKPEWEKFTRDSTTKAVEELTSSPDFGRWVSKNADRITITPPSGTRAEQRRKWFPWF